MSEHKERQALKRLKSQTRRYKFPKYSTHRFSGGPEGAGRNYRALAKQHAMYARGLDKAAEKRKREIGRSDTLVKTWRAEARRERNIARRALEKAKRYRGVYSRDPSRSYTTTIHGHRVRVEYHPRSGLFSTTLLGKGGRTLAGPSGKTAHEAEESMRRILRRSSASNDSRRRSCRDCIGIHTHENMGRAALKAGRERRRRRRRGYR